ncbi:phosphonate ABC transporter substrate-binding protein [Frateuria sp. Soil773]|uniref:phosphate/phosphite/phosphonate ABC transporter substrate-binding protein n=1 Tax=Frateuria sp. Soil773 TaxID=1736407 RepID=UPI0006F85D57|nr:phosphate/phosphite/phosphonate ABC transporter substrate-binding protein [Frateuria sp. Soil773]KRF00359.1 phosphonate ABC transporter substrate-binding protein [Frateuria sp. Soil773]
MGAGLARPLRRALLAAACALLPPALPAQTAAAPHADARPLTFGILPIGGPSESLEAWRPMLDDLARALQRPVRSISVSTYEGLAQALAEERVDVAFVSGQMALNAVIRDRMQVIAQLTRSDGSRGYYAVLLVQKDSPLRTLAGLFAQPGHWRYARGESLSVSGYLVPETQLFASRGLDSDTFFASVAIDNHQNNALAVANGEADVATNNTADLERFRSHFPDQYARLRILWKSSQIPHAVIVVRSDLPDPLRGRLADFLDHYGRSGRDAAAELAKLKLIHDISGFAAAGNDTLVPFADIEYNLERRRALTAQWIDDAAMQARLRKIGSEHAALVQQLRGRPPADRPMHGDNP